MASKSGIAERRLKPLWDAIDHRQYKSALKLASGLLTKHPDNSYLLALKALVSEKLGKVEEATTLALRAKSTNPVDDATLNTLQTVFQRLNNLEAATSLFEHACSKNPRSLDIHTALFNCYVRQYLYVKQQQVAIKLYKIGGDERFLLWAICSITLQVNNGNGKLLQLAEALLKKHTDAHGLRECEGLLVYLEVLKRQQKYGEALKLLQGLSGDLFTIATDRLRLQGELLVHLHQYKEAAHMFEEIMKLSSDDWVSFRMYLDAMLNTTKEVSFMSKTDSLTSSAKKEVDGILQQVHKFVLELQGLEVSELRRGPYLAVLEIEKRQMLLAPCKDETEKPSFCLAQSILKYFERFGSMASFASDVLEFVSFIQGGQRLWLVHGLHQYCRDLPSTTRSIKALRFRLAAFQVEGQLGWQAHDCEAGLVAVVTELGHLFLKSVELSVEVDSQEAMLGGEILTLITNLLVELYLRTKQLGYVLEAILVLELGLALQRFHPQHKIFLVSLYAFLSAIKPAWDRFKAVDVKYILLESMSHHILPSLVSSLEWDALDSMLRDIAKFHDDYRRESADLAVLAYQHGTYTKVLEFVAFKEKLERSHQLMVVRIESVILCLKQKASTPEELEVALLESSGGGAPLEWVTDSRLDALTFNEDLQTRPWWSPTPDECLLTGSSESVRKARNQHPVENELQDLVTRRNVGCKKALKLRCCLPRMLHLALRTATGNKAADLGVGSELKALVTNYAEVLGVGDEDLGLWLSRKCASSEFKDIEPQVGVEDLLTVGLFWTASQFPFQWYDPAYKENQFSDSLALLNELVAVSLHDAMHASITGTEVLASGLALAKLGKLISESLAWVGLCLQSWAIGLQPGSKKKKHLQAVPDSTEVLLGVLHKATMSFCSHLETCSSWTAGCLEKVQKKGVEGLLASLERDSSGSPGCVLGTLTRGLNKETKVPETWQQKTLLQAILDSQQETMVKIKGRCKLRLQVLKSVKF